MRKILYDILENSNKNNNINKYYNLAMIVIVTISLIPLCTHKENVILNYIDKITLIIFALDYILRLITADYKIKKGRMSFLLYIITPMAIIDILSILPILVIFPKGLGTA